MRPQFHFTARTGWINDPHGVTARDGRYDVFYQYVPGQTEWGPNCHWGHARGDDLF
jgi:beta-fructofuranosidase